MSSLASVSPICTTQAKIVSSNCPSKNPPKKSLSAVQTIYMGNSIVLKAAREAIKDPMTHFKMDPFSSKSPKAHSFIRDARVIRNDGLHLIPYSIQDTFLRERFKSLLPATSDSFILYGQGGCGYGYGFEENERQKAIDTAKHLQQPFLLAKTCIEGGNCFLTKKGAIVGIHSVILSIIALQEQYFFDKTHLAVRAKNIKMPKRFFVRMARNSALYAKRRRCNKNKTVFLIHQAIQKQFGGESGYRKLITAPITEKDRIYYHSAAKRWQAYWEIAKEVMADELGIQRPSLTIIDQAHFHIDLDIAQGPKRLLLVNNPQQAIAVVERRAQKVKGIALTYFQSMLVNMRKNLRNQTTILKLNLLRFKKLDLQVIRVPGVYRTENGEGINLLNGLFLKSSSGVRFATQGTAHPLDRHLLKPFAETLWKYNIEPIFLDVLAQSFAETQGGLHCLTWKQKKNYPIPVVDQGQSRDNAQHSSKMEKKHIDNT